MYCKSMALCEVKSHFCRKEKCVDHAYLLYYFKTLINIEMIFFFETIEIFFSV